MMGLTIAKFQLAMPGAGPRILLYADWLNKTMDEFAINTDKRVAHFLPQIAHESGDLNRVEENLNYSADGLANTWPHRYAEKDAAGKWVLENRRHVPNDLARRLHRNPVAIANNVYANRMGNRDEASGDGWATRGAGLIQLTGMTNHRAYAEYFGIPFAEFGAWLRSPEGACRSAGRFWQVNGCNQFADNDDLDAIADAISLGRQTEKYGDAIGFTDRLRRVGAAKKGLA